MSPEVQAQFDEIRAILAQTAQLQRDTAVKLDQEAELWREMRQAMTEQNRQIQENRADIARLNTNGNTE